LSNTDVEPFKEVEEIPKDFQAQQPFESNLIYQGRKAKRVNFTTNKITLAPRTYFYNPINFEEEGELISFTVAVNDPGMKVICFLYDQDGTAEEIVNRSMREVSFLGRGFTLAEAEEVLPIEVSIDKSGKRHPVRPWLSRYKNTFSQPNQLYNDVKGTENDKWIVLEYTPEIRETYSRIYFTVQNPLNESRMIHHMTISRIVFIDVFKTNVVSKQAEELNNVAARRLVDGRIRPKIER
jgi:hypothetical protein